MTGNCTGPAHIAGGNKASYGSHPKGFLFTPREGQITHYRTATFGISRNTITDINAEGFKKPFVDEDGNVIKVDGVNPGEPVPSEEFSNNGHTLRGTDNEFVRQWDGKENRKPVKTQIAQIDWRGFTNRDVLTYPGPWKRHFPAGKNIYDTSPRFFLDDTIVDYDTDSDPFFALPVEDCVGFGNKIYTCGDLVATMPGSAKCLGAAIYKDAATDSEWLVVMGFVSEVAVNKGGVTDIAYMRRLSRTGGFSDNTDETTSNLVIQAGLAADADGNNVPAALEEQDKWFKLKEFKFDLFVSQDYEFGDQTDLQAVEDNFFYEDNSMPPYFFNASATECQHVRQGTNVKFTQEQGSPDLEPSFGLWPGKRFKISFAHTIEEYELDTGQVLLYPTSIVTDQDFDVGDTVRTVNEVSVARALFPEDTGCSSSTTTVNINSDTVVSVDYDGDQEILIKYTLSGTRENKFTQQITAEQDTNNDGQIDARSFSLLETTQQSFSGVLSWGTQSKTLFASSTNFRRFRNQFNQSMTVESNSEIESGRIIFFDPRFNLLSTVSQVATSNSNYATANSNESNYDTQANIIVREDIRMGDNNVEICKVETPSNNSEQRRPNDFFPQGVSAFNISRVEAGNHTSCDLTNPQGSYSSPEQAFYQYPPLHNLPLDRCPVGSWTVNNDGVYLVSQLTHWECDVDDDAANFEPDDDYTGEHYGSGVYNHFNGVDDFNGAGIPALSEVQRTDPDNKVVYYGAQYIGYDEEDTQ